MAWSKDDKQWLSGTEGRVNGQVRNRENHRQQRRENPSARVSTIGGLEPVRPVWTMRCFVAPVKASANKQESRVIAGKPHDASMPM